MAIIANRFYPVIISNSTGQQVYKKAINHGGGTLNVQVNAPKGLQPAIYTVQALLPDSTAKVQKLVIATAK